MLFRSIETVGQVVRFQLRHSDNWVTYYLEALDDKEAAQVCSKLKTICQNWAVAANARLVAHTPHKKKVEKFYLAEDDYGFKGRYLRKLTDRR